MKFLIVDTYYPEFLKSFYAGRPELVDASYEDTLNALMSCAFGTADFYSKNLRLLGHQADDVIANDKVLQDKWGCGLAERIKQECPDVLYFQNISLCEPSFISTIRPFVKLIVGQIGCPLLPESYMSGCDLIVSSIPSLVERIRRMGIDSEYLGIAFESTLLSRLTKSPDTYDTVFVGGFSDPVHAERSSFIDVVNRETPIDVWGYGDRFLTRGLRKQFHGEAWGLDMFNIFYNSKIVVNRHGYITAEDEAYANNMRLYEATGAGAMLITDKKENLGELFEVHSEVVTYYSAGDLAWNIGYYLTHEDERAEIARAGQARTLRDHTYLQRMTDLVGIVGVRFG